MTIPAWSTQQLAECLPVVSSSGTEASAVLAAVERAAEALDAEVAAIVCSSAVVASVRGGLNEVLADLQEISRGLHPAILSQGGSETALATLARRSAVPVELSVRSDGHLPTRGSGLVGLIDRVEALGGTIDITSLVGTGTSLLVTMPIDAR
jgi:signal transduction histidine kinase